LRRLSEAIDQRQLRELEISKKLGQEALSLKPSLNPSSPSAQEALIRQERAGIAEGLNIKHTK